MRCCQDNHKKPRHGRVATRGRHAAAKVEIADQPQFAGSKAASSGKLEKLAGELGFKAPKGLAIPFGVMKKAVQGSDFESALKALQSKLNGNSPDVEAAALAVRAAVEKMAVPSNILKEVASKLPGAERVAVRSSANSEDLEKVSGAGLHDSVLSVDIKDQSKLQSAVLQVWSSMFTLRAVQSRHAAGMPLYEGIAMGVLIQPMVSLAGSAFAFIAFSKDAVARNDKAVYIELCIGLGETLASANEPGTPYRLIVQKQAPHEVEVASLGSFSYALQDMPGGLQRVPIDYSQERLSTDREYLVQMARDIGKVAIGIEQGASSKLFPRRAALCPCRLMLLPVVPLDMPDLTFFARLRCSYGHGRRCPRTRWIKRNTLGASSSNCRRVEKSILYMASDKQCWLLIAPSSRFNSEKSVSSRISSSQCNRLAIQFK